MNASIATLPDCSPNTANADSGVSTKGALTVGCYVTGM